MRRGRIVVAAAVLAALSSGPLAAQQPSPYDMRFKLRGSGAQPLHADMSETAGAVATLPAGTRGIVLRWCRKEFDFGSWQFGTAREQLAILDARWCEVSWNGIVGNVPGKALAPE